MKTTKTILLTVALAIARQLSAQSTAITYQGRLSAGGTPANGTYDLRFAVFDAVANGTAASGWLTNTAISLSAGELTVTLDFGAGVFSGAPRWLEIGVRTNGSIAPYSILTPRQMITPAPYAVQSLSASNLLGYVADNQLSANIARVNGNPSFIGAVSFNPLLGSPFKVNNAALVTNLNADFLDGLHSTAFAATGHVHSAADINSGTLGDPRLSSNVPLLNRGQTFTTSNTFAGVLTATNATNVIVGSFSGNGAGLGNLAAVNLTGVIGESLLPANVPRLSSNQTFTGAVTFNPASGPPLRVNSTTLVTNLNADALDGLGAGAFWNVGGNGGTTNGNFLGTVDNQALDLRVNNQRGLRLEPNATGANLIGGSAANQVTNAGAAIVAGGLNNVAGGNFAVVAGGINNFAGAPSATVGGGLGNAATNTAATVPGGAANLAGGPFSFAAGQKAQALHDGAFVWSDNSSATAFTSTAPNTVIFRAAGGVGIGTNNPQSALHVAGTLQAAGFKLTTAPAVGAVLSSDGAGNGSWQPAAVRLTADATSPNLIGGHASNTVAAGVSGATIGGGGTATFSNYVAANFGTVAGGFGNSVAGTYGAVGGGYRNSAPGFAAFVGGGYLNQATNSYSALVGGYGNSANSLFGFVGGGYQNLVSGYGAAVGGGELNSAAGYEAFVGGGYRNAANGNYSFVGGGYLNRATNYTATVAGGYSNLAGGQYSFAAGQNAQALHTGAFVWGDYSATTPFASTAPNQFLIRAAGGVGINTSNPNGAALSVNGSSTLNGNLRLNNFDLVLRGDPDFNHGLGWYGSDAVWPNKLFAGQAPDGPVLYGYSGGGLGTTAGGQNLALTWTRQGTVGIGTANPDRPLSIQGYEWISFKKSSGATAWHLNNNLDGLNFVQTGVADARLFLSTNNGYVGIGLLDPAAKLDINTGAGRLQVRSEGVTPGLNVVGGGAPGVLRLRNSLEIWPDDGATRLGHLDLRDLTGNAQISLNGDGNITTTGNTSVGGKLTFGATTRQMVDLYNSLYGIGVQAWTSYFRTDPQGNFAWYAGGTHNDGENNPGPGGTVRMLMDWHGNLTIQGTLYSASDRNVKANFLPVDAQEILNQVVALPLTTWNYTNDLVQVRHLGPVAQDFRAAFGLGVDDKSIATVDTAGVALAAIQGLNQKLEARGAELTRQEMEITELKARNQNLELRLARLEQVLNQISR